MTIYLSAKTNYPDMFIDFIMMELKDKTEVAIDWDDSSFTRKGNDFDADYDNVCFAEVHADGRLDDVKSATIKSLQVWSDSCKDGSTIKFEITKLSFEDGSQKYDIPEDQLKNIRILF